MICLKITLLIIKAQVTCTKNYVIEKVKKNNDQVYLIKEVLDRLKEAIKNVSEDKKIIINKNKMIINIAEHILYFNQPEQQDSG